MKFENSTSSFSRDPFPLWEQKWFFSLSLAPLRQCKLLWNFTPKCTSQGLRQEFQRTGGVGECQYKKSYPVSAILEKKFSKVDKQAESISPQFNQLITESLRIFSIVISRKNRFHCRSTNFRTAGCPCHALLRIDEWISNRATRSE